MFQSAPRSEELGDAPGGARGAPWPVSIRAPLRGAGRWAAEVRWGRRRVFQSAPRSEELGDVSCCDRRDWLGGVSIRAPLRGAGRSPCCSRLPALAGCFNPRPAPRSWAIADEYRALRLALGS